MPNNPVPAAAEGVPDSQATLILRAEDIANETLDLIRLLGMAIDFVERGYEINALAAGVAQVEKRMEVLVDALFLAKGARR